MPWKLTVRAGPMFERLSFDELARALTALESRAQGFAEQARRRPVDVRVRRFEPVQQVAARIELAGPERLLPSTHVGVDVRGDGSTVAYEGRVRRRVLEPRPGETAADALRRVLT